jgi:hypothetical protein
MLMMPIYYTEMKNRNMETLLKANIEVDLERIGQKN